MPGYLGLIFQSGVEMIWSWGSAPVRLGVPRELEPPVLLCDCSFFLVHHPTRWAVSSGSWCIFVYPLASFSNWSQEIVQDYRPAWYFIIDGFYEQCLWYRPSREKSNKGQVKKRMLEGKLPGPCLQKTHTWDELNSISFKAWKQLTLDKELQSYNFC